MSERVGILTLPLNPNYGGMLQAVALYAFLERNGRDIVFMDKRAYYDARRRIKNRIMENIPVGVIRALARTPLARRLRRQAPNEYDMTPHRRFLRTHLRERTARLYDSRGLVDAVRRHAIGTVIVGSDQVWNYGLKWLDGVDTYFCGFLADRDTRRVAYAASFGHDRWGFHDMTDKARANLARFDAVSVREASGVRICAEVLGRSDGVHVLDPTLLLEPEFYRTMTAEIVAPEGPVLLEYVLDVDADKRALTDAALRTLDRPHATQRLSTADGLDVVDVPTWIAAFRDANFVITDSFHGTIFSILFRRNFVSILNESRGGDRFFSLLGQLGLADRLISRDDIEKARFLARTPIDFDPVHRRIESLRAQSAAFLLSAVP